MKLKTFALLVALTASPAYGAKTTITASNGVAVDVNGDDFSGRYEYSAPGIQISGDGLSGQFMVAAIREKGALREADQGFVVYSGDWRNYSSAVYRGGDSAQFESGSHDVGGCSYGSCTLSEDFFITIPKSDVVKHAENGVIPIQVRASSTHTFIINVPVSYIQAVDEVSQKS